MQFFLAISCKISARFSNSCKKSFILVQVLQDLMQDLASLASISCKISARFSNSGKKSFILVQVLQDLMQDLASKGGGNRGARGGMAPLKIFLEGPGPSKITDDPSSVMNFYSTL